MDIYTKLIDVFGSQAEIARALRLKSPQVVNNWWRRGSIPADYYPAIVSASKGTISIEDFFKQ